MPNEQLISKPSYRLDGALDFISAYPTIQGEGPWAGTPAIFIRLGGCSLQCPLCDTDYTTKSSLCDVSLILREVAKAGTRLGSPRGYQKPLVVITGGEPLRQNLKPLIDDLHKVGLPIQIETNGLHCPDDFPWCRTTIVCSPKTAKIHPNLLSRIHAFKYVLRSGEVDPNDGLPTKALGYEYLLYRPDNSFKGGIYVQPLDELDDKKNKLNTNAAIQSCMKFGYRLCLQTQKIVGLP